MMLAIGILIGAMMGVLLMSLNNIASSTDRELEKNPWKEDGGTP